MSVLLHDSNGLQCSLTIAIASPQSLALQRGTAAWRGDRGGDRFSAIVVDKLGKLANAGLKVDCDNSENPLEPAPG
jgi:hypothetical protein